jgi:hypothetical protein
VPHPSISSANRISRTRSIDEVQPLIALALTGLVVLVNWGAAFPQSRDSIAQVKRAPRIVDSLLWKTPAVARFFIKVLGDSQSVNYRGFMFKNAGPFTTQEFGSYKPSTPPQDSSWVYTPNHRLGASIFAGWDPDSELRLYNRKSEGKIERLEFCGTPCRYKGIFWLDNRRLVFVQTYEDYHQINDSTGAVTGYTPIVTLYDIPAESSFTYVTTPIPVRPSK